MKQTRPVAELQIQEASSAHPFQSKPPPDETTSVNNPRHPLSILVISDNSARLLQLKQFLENWLQDSEVSMSSDKLTSVPPKYFDLIVVELEADKQAASNIQEELRCVVQKLEAHTGLNHLPLIILTNCDEVRTLVTPLVTDSLYCLGKDASTEATLIQIITLIHYLTYRYM